MSEVYSLHRQTAYLAQDFFDRYMLTQEDVSKERLQLLGITALFIASKMEVSVAPEGPQPSTRNQNPGPFLLLRKFTLRRSASSPT